MRSLRRFSAVVLAYNLAVILWGAVVRASGSGAGCGSHWPLCNGVMVPGAASTATLVEYSHRVSSGLVLVLVLVLAVWAFRVSLPGHPVRRGAVLAVAFTLSEAAVGAGLVLFKLVARDESLARALAIGTHLLNTFLLLAALALTWRWAGQEEGAAGAPGGDLPGDLSRLTVDRSLQRPPARLAWACWTAVAGLMLVGASGAISALGDTLFPSSTLRQGLAQDVSPSAHLLLRLRVLHPFLALAAGLFLFYLCQRALALPAARRWAHRLRLLVLAQWTAGALDLGLLAPVWLQLLHLLLADLVWLALVLLAADLVASQPSRVHVAASTVPYPPPQPPQQVHSPANAPTN